MKKFIILTGDVRRQRRSFIVLTQNQTSLDLNKDPNQEMVEHNLEEETDFEKLVNLV